MVTPFGRLAGLFVLLACTAFAQLATTNLALEFNAGTDPQGDAVWTDTALGVQTLAFTTAPVRASIDTAGANYPVLSVGYATPASGLNGYFDTGSPVRSTVSGTFELWLNVTSLTGGADQVVFEAGGADTGISFTLTNATLNFNVDGLFTSSDQTISKELTAGMHHVVGVITCTKDNSANDSLSLYVDGVLVQTLANVNIDDWAGANPSGIGAAAGGSVTGAVAPVAFHGQVASLRYYSRALTLAQVSQNNAVYRERLATYITGVSVTNNYTVTTNSGFTPTRTRTINGVLYGFNQVVSDGTDGLVATQFIRWDLYSSADNGSTWTFLKTMIDRTNPAFTNTIFQSPQLLVTPAGYIGIYLKNLYAVTPPGATDNRKFLTGIVSETPTGDYRVAFDERPFGEPSGDLGNVVTGGQLYIVSANTTDGYINIFNVGARGDSLVAHTLHKQWLLPDNTVDHREAPAVFFQGGYWFLTTSGRTGWRPNQHKYAYATSLGGPWSSLIDLGDATGYHSQLFFVATAGTSSSRIFSATRNAPQWDGEGGSRPVWLPLRFNRVPDMLATNYYDLVTVNYTTGVVEGFHYDRGRQIPVTQATLVGSADNISAIVDGDESTSWGNGAVVTKRTVDLALGSVNLVKALKIKPLDEWRWTYKVKIYVGDGTTFTQVFPKGTEPSIIPNTAFLGPIDVTPTSGSVVRIENYASYQEGTPNNRFGLYEVQVWGGTSSTGAELTESFDSYPSNWVTSAQTGATASVVTVPGDATPALKLTDTNPATRVQVSKSLSAQNGSLVAVEWKYRADNAGTGEFLRLFQGSTVALDLVSSQTLTAATGSTTLAMTDNAGTETSLKQLTVGAWHAFRLEVNTDTDTFDLYIDGQLAWLGGKLRNPVTALDKIMVGTGTPSANVSSYFDDVSVDGPNPAGNVSNADLIEQLTLQVTELQAEVSSLQAGQAVLVNELRAASDDYAALNGLYQASTAEVTALRASLASTEARLTAAEAALAQAQASIQTLEASLQAANTQIAGLTAEKTQLTEALAEARASNQALSSQVSTLTTSLADTTTRLSAAEAGLAQAQASIQALEASLQAANTEIGNLTAEKTQLTAALAGARASNQTLGAQVSALTASLAETVALLNSAETALTRAQATIRSLETSLQAANTQIGNLTAEKNQLSAALAETVAINQAINAQIAGMKTSLDAIASLLGQTFGDTAFQLPGATPEEKLAALVQGINGLNHGQKQALYKALGGQR